ncbi:Nonsense-mediated mRNA decay protein 5 [Coemansia spiralis]|uniref:Nonsense-mediated mRNA decay protein 5 n=2 Tax=Coemansia TaxID=4863 RepID=A0A9W8GD01_9FUNG|nr:armadillo-type protein [Coemansia spiralis]KAJ1986872.1 Nonsense-mediated mRNA decay protein 5 [Coemansia umbellata]KAJ2624684.1 Nonsense-mediated mRNA decay protein 5 [Coemansia sp. RSA 1358]KAJ2679730.1 Nonsense-mediated mRNA decay protein 5 [Coemansia spiralis]
MDLQSLAGLFDSTLHQDPALRQNAENQLQQLESHEGFLTTLLQMIGMADITTGIKQAASIYFKNRIRRSWSGSARALEQYPPINEGERTFAKENILGAIYASSQAIKLQLTECFGVMLKFDFPEKWPQLMVQLKELLHAQDAQKVYTGILALLEVIKAYRYATAKRDMLDEIAKELLPQVQQIADQAIVADDDLAMRMAWVSFKCYYNSIQSGIPPSFKESNNLVAWGTSFIKMIEKPVAFDRDAISEEAAQEPVWKAKKWAIRSVNRLYSRFGNPALLPSGSVKKHSAFAKLFTANFLPQIMQVYLKQIEGYTTGHVWMSLRVRGFISQFLSDCVKEKSAWKLLKPHVEGIVAHFIFPQMCFSEADQELWEDNPVEYVQKRIDPIDDFGSANMAASNLLVDFAIDRKKSTLSIILDFINKVLATYAQSPVEARDPRSKDGVLNMMGALCSVLSSRKSPIAYKLEEFLLTHVVPEFKSKYGFLRARALDTFCRYSGVEFSNLLVTQGVFESVLGLLNDPELPVRVHAALALQPMIENEAIRNQISGHLPDVMQVFLNLTNEIDSDTITHVIEEFVEIFADKMAPFALQLGQQLCDTFMRVMGDAASNPQDLSNADIDDISDKTMAAAGVLKTLGTLVINLESSPEVVYQLEEVVFPVIRFVLEQRLIDLYDEVYEILDCCMFSVKAVSPNAWTLFGTIYHSFKNDGIDFIEEMLPSLDNYVSYGIDLVAANNEVQSRLFDIIETVMKSDRVGENDRVCACKLAEAIMLHGRGKVDGMIPGFISLAAAYLLVADAIQTSALLVHALEVVLNALHYNPVITLNVLEQYKWTEGIFTRLIQNISKFSRVHDKKLLILGLASVLSVPAEHLPSALQSGLIPLFEGILQTFRSYGTAIEARDAIEKMYEGEGDLDDEYDNLENEFEWDGNEDDELEGFEDDDDNADDYDNELLKQLAGKASKALGSDEDDDDNLGSDDDDYDADLEEEFSLETPLDSINAYIFFQDKLTEIQNANAAVYGAIVQGLNQENSQYVQSLINEANKQRAELASQQ